MNRHELQELKEQVRHDAFTDAVGGAVQYATGHRKDLIRWGVLALAVLVAIGAALWFASARSAARQADLEAALSIADAPVGSSDAAGRNFATAEEKNKATLKALSDVIAKDGGSREGMIARYYRGTLQAQSGQTKAAEDDLHAVANSSSQFSALSKIALAQIYAGQNRTAEAQNLLRDLSNKSADLVSKQQAQLLLAQMLASTNPAEAKRLVQSVKTANPNGAVARAADQVLSQPGR